MKIYFRNISCFYFAVLVVACLQIFIPQLAYGLLCSYGNCIVEQSDYKEIMRDSVNSLEKEYGLLKDSEKQVLVDKVSAKFKKALSLSSLTQPIQILNTDMVNAFSIIGWKIYVTKGVLDMVSSEEELAFVIAHEIAHAYNDDPKNRRYRTKRRLYWL